MSKFNIYTIYDTAAKRAGSIFLSVNDEIADRQFKKYIETVKKETEQIAQYQDLKLMNIGIYEMGEDDKEPEIISTKKYRIDQIPAGMKPKDHSDNKKISILEQFKNKIRGN